MFSKSKAAGCDLILREYSSIVLLCVSSIMIIIIIINNNNNLLIAKLQAFGLGFDTATFFFTYLKERKQKISINNISSVFKINLSGVPQGSILAQFCSTYSKLNDLFLWLKNSDVHNFARGRVA